MLLFSDDSFKSMQIFIEKKLFLFIFILEIIKNNNFRNKYSLFKLNF